ncbi:MAG TPA: FmdE family protein [Anaerolineae bacterium]|nr:FmdE family protein [Anaerolineae bacterium]HPL30406.1 FmdE family protein [Anaerolineae bacterium]
MKGKHLWQGQWVLHFKVEEEEEAHVLVDARLRLAAAFHGHLCPDLAIGYRASQCALARLSLELMYGAPLRVIVENTTSMVRRAPHFGAHPLRWLWRLGGTDPLDTARGEALVPLLR